MAEPEETRDTRKPDRVVWALALLTGLAIAAAVVVRLMPREAPETQSIGTDVQDAGRSDSTPMPPQELQGPMEHSDARPADVVSPMLAEFVNRKATNRVTAGFSARVERVETEADLAAVVAVLKDTKDSDTVRNEAAKLLARSGYAQLIPDLITILLNPAEGPRFRSFCVQHLWLNYPAADEKLRGALDIIFQERLSDPDMEVRREALLALVRLGSPEGRRTAEQWLVDPNTHDVRDLAIHCMEMLDLREQAPEIRKYLHDKNNTVRIAAVVVLSTWGDQESRAAFEAAANSDDQRLQRAGKAALLRLSRLSATNAPLESAQSEPQAQDKR